jgi:hypothetical protein
MLLHVDKLHSYEILNELHKGDLSCKPGWIRMSIHPVMTNEEVLYVLDAIEQVVLHYQEWKKDYVYDADTNEFHFQSFVDPAHEQVNEWFSKPLS